ncbi:Hypothetical Protein FCC1311_054032 [Hondaea fermentalgiana]|uniref:Chromosome segregation in meiosis protein 3 domain-containing protein n=1 Tax=Hondaea fermentalgiana TaxID=2315210 RepID=A0A2R5GLM4_9STRA|nr:Hypothetical Protein FCC1311_054032 [Hondaea fermentalgiana]|eukprot:GBG29181.1 Hypothetical Protein FCC1311_054032 [Hondaea fermentalgiana]
MVDFADEESDDGERGDVDLVVPQLDPANSGAGADGEDEDGDLVAGEVVVAKKKRQQGPRLKSEYIVDERTGLRKLVGMFEGFEARGEGREAADIDRLLRKCEIWAADLVPGMKLSLAEFVHRTNRGGGGKDLKRSDINGHLQTLRDAEAERVFGSLFPHKKTSYEDEDESEDEKDGDDETNRVARPAHDDDDNANASKSKGSNDDVAERIRKNREAALARRRAFQAEAQRSSAELPDGSKDVADAKDDEALAEHSKSDEDVANLASRDASANANANANSNEDANVDVEMGEEASVGDDDDDEKEDNVSVRETRQEKETEINVPKRRKVFEDSDDEDDF